MTANGEPRPLYTVAAVAACLGVSARQVRNLLKRGKLPPASKVGQRLCWPAAAFDAWLAAGGSASQASRVENGAESVEPEAG